MSTLITGSNGFIGNNLATYLKSKGFQIITSSRKKYDDNGIKHFNLKEVNKLTNWFEVLEGVKNIVHTAACVHQISKGDIASAKNFKEVNTLGSINLFKQAIECRVEKFIFLSTIGVCGSESKIPFNEKSPVDPKTLYAKSKLDAERSLISLAKNSKTKLIIIRPPMVIGPGAPGNFERLVNLIKMNLPLPLGSVKFNKRSFLSISNLNDFIYKCLLSDELNDILFVLADSQDYSTAKFIDLLSSSMNKRSTLFQFPPSILKFLFKIIGKKELSKKLLSNMQIDSSYARKVLNWKPSISIKSELENCFK